MESLFRFVLKRPADQGEDEPARILLVQNTDFQASLAKAQAQSSGHRDAMKSVAKTYIASSSFVGDQDIAGIGKAIRALSAALDQLETQDTLTNAQVSDAVKTAFGQTPMEFRGSGVLDALITALKDSLIAIKLVPEEHQRPIQHLADGLRELEVIEKLAVDGAFPATGKAMRAFRRRTLQLPGETGLKSILSTRQRQRKLAEEQKTEDEKRRKKAETSLNLYRRIMAAVDELTALGTDNIRTTPQEDHDGFVLPDAVSPINVLLEDMEIRRSLTKLDIERAEVRRPIEVRGRETEKEIPQEVRFQREVLPAARTLLRGSPAFKLEPLKNIGFRLKESAGERLSKDTFEILIERNLRVTEHPLDEIVRALKAEIVELSSELDTGLGRAVNRTFKRIGTKMVMISTPQASVWNELVIGNVMKPEYLAFPADLRVPTSHGDLAPAGVADLLVVKQQLMHYEGADVAHIENVLKGENKGREHTRRRETEEFTFVETEVTTSEERELESTTRFEMSQETSKTLKEDASLKGGLTLSGKYGPTVEFSASAEASFSSSKEEATKSASQFSQDVTERTATKVTERVLERASLKVTNEVIEKNTHGIDNTTGSGHIAGVYQWVNKVYQAQMFNYGIRMMYDFMVPEPAAFLITAMQNAHANALELEKPTPFTLRPDQIHESNYTGWVQQYGATDVVPPPELYLTKSHDHNANSENEDVEFSHSAQIAIDDGYSAIHATVGCVRTIWDKKAIVDVIVGSQAHRFLEDNGWVWSTSLNDETGSLPIALVTDLVGDMAMAIEIKCRRTHRAYKAWQIDTHAKLTTAFRARMAEYEEELKALEVQAGVEIEGLNPSLNMELMKDELKKHCISILTEQHFDLFDAIDVGGYGVEQVDLFQNEAEGPYVRFFEQAFEWEQMTWLTYPYFWGRKSQWRDRLAYDDPDPIFNQFLKSGYCRAVVPVRPGFEGAIDHFMTFGEIWNGGPLPTISNPHYLPIAEEIAERLDRPGEEVPQGDPWTIRIPTTLVHLRADDKLPVWTQDPATGEWVAS
ncbi:hypothetical protein [Microbulbifer aggregans]|uniref:hypothetical protein n=1 Tax=Microbulbifer aggregans TaxID=1769779 RepID=UPI001CFF0288|nr:hypothetical protein [Microbulbifer aggregans]